MSRYFRQLARDWGFPEAYEGNYTVVGDVYVLKVVHVYNAAQLATALAEDYVTDVNDSIGIAVHAGINVEPAELGKMASYRKKLLLGPGVNATNIRDGEVDVYMGAKASKIFGGFIRVYKGGKASDIRGGSIWVNDEDDVDGNKGGEILVWNWWSESFKRQDDGGNCVVG